MNYPHSSVALGLFLILLINAGCPHPVLDLLGSLGIESGNEAEAAFRISLDSLTAAFHSRLSRTLQDLPPPFVPTRACNEIFTTTTAEEVRQLADLFLLALFPPGSANEGLLDVARSVLVSQVKYDVKVAKVCMSCAEARNVLSQEQANNTEAYGFGSYCSDEAYGSDAVHSSLVFIPAEVGSKSILSGQVRGAISNRGTTTDLYSSPSEFWPVNVTDYTSTAPIEDIVVSMTNYLVPAIFGVSGAIAIAPDFLGYGESYQTPRAYFVLGNMAQSGALAWLATQEFVRTVSNGCTVLEAAASVAGYSEGGTATIPVALALRALDVNVVGAYVGGGVYSPTINLAKAFEIFDEESPELDPTTLFLWKLLLPMFGYSYSIENSFLSHTGSGQIFLSQNYSQGGVETNVYEWFNPSDQLSNVFAFTEFVPDDVADVLNPDLRSIYDEARALGEVDACSGFVSATTDKLCETILDADLIDDMTNLIDFNTVLCHSKDDELVTYDNFPTFPFPNSLVSQYEGVVGVLPLQGSHFVANILCAVSPISQLQVSGETGPVLIVPLENPPAQCLGTSEAPAPAEPTPTMPSPPGETPSAPPTAMPSGSTALGPWSLLTVSSVLIVATAVWIN